MFQPPEFEIIRSSRRSLALQFTREGKLLVRAPLHTPEAVIARFVAEQEAWIQKQQRRFAARTEELKDVPPLTEEELADLTRRAKLVIPRRVEYYAPLVGVDYGRITIRHQSSKWGSCTAEGNLNFNCLLMLAPAEVLDSVVVHELCHRKHMNHSPAFYAEVKRVFPDYARQHKWLKENGSFLLSLLPSRERG